MAMILAEAAGEPGGLERRIQSDPTLALKPLAEAELLLEVVAAAELLILEVESLRACLAKVHDGYPDEVRAADLRVSELRAVIAKVRATQEGI